jgi:drug/metabolite transporter (DMT)-like permease
MLSNKQNVGLLLGLLGVCFFAATLPATRIALFDTNPWFLTSIRAVIAGFAGLTMLIVTRRRLPPRKLIPTLILCASMVVLGFPLAVGIAMVTVPSAHGGVIMGILPLATAAAAAVIQHERPSRGFWIAAVIGSALVMTFALYRGGGHSLSPGDMFLLVAVVCGGIGYTLSGRLSGFMPGWEVISWVVTFSLPVALAATVLTWPADIGAISTRGWMAILYVGLVAQYYAFFLWRHCQGGSDLAVATLLCRSDRRDFRRRKTRLADLVLRCRRGDHRCHRHADACRRTAGITPRQTTRTRWQYFPLSPAKAGIQSHEAAAAGPFLDSHFRGNERLA